MNSCKKRLLEHCILSQLSPIWHASVYFQTVWPKITRDYVIVAARGGTALYFTVLKTETSCQKFVRPSRELVYELESLYLQNTNSSAVKTEAADSSETLVAIQQITWRHILEGYSINF
jgi:hypothetical protein